jgi:hypothetical protein
MPTQAIFLLLKIRNVKEGCGRPIPSEAPMRKVYVPWCRYNNTLRKNPAHGGKDAFSFLKRRYTV